MCGCQAIQHTLHKQIVLFGLVPIYDRLSEQLEMENGLVHLTLPT